jgi:sugar/nucleoside kinase (ribokinase family)
MSGVVCCGNIVLDILVRPVDRLGWGTSTWVESIEQHLGGNGANTAYALGLMGVPVRLLATAGADAFGDYALARLGAAGVDLAFVQRSASPTAATVVLVNPSGERLFLHRPGASAESFPQPVEFSAGITAGASHFHLANLFGLPHMRVHSGETMRRAKAAGLATSIDTGWDSRGRWLDDVGPCLPHTDLVFVNETEVRHLAGIDDARAASRRLLELGARSVVLKLGAAGSVVITAEGEIAASAFQVTAVDTTGAGDCFAGAFLAAIVRGYCPGEAARMANAAAALAIQKLGATEGVAGWDTVQDWMRTATVIN